MAFWLNKFCWKLILKINIKSICIRRVHCFHPIPLRIYIFFTYANNLTNNLWYNIEFLRVEKISFPLIFESLDSLKETKKDLTIIYSRKSLENPSVGDLKFYKFVRYTWLAIFWHNSKHNDPRKREEKETRSNREGFAITSNPPRQLLPPFEYQKHLPLTLFNRSADGTAANLTPGRRGILIKNRDWAENRVGLENYSIGSFHRWGEREGLTPRLS